MVEIEFILEKGSENNPFGEEVIKQVAARKMELLYGHLRDVVKDMSCEEHPDYVSKIVINGQTQMVNIVACCDLFHDKIKKAIT